MWMSIKGKNNPKLRRKKTTKLNQRKFKKNKKKGKITEKGVLVEGIWRFKREKK